MARPTLYKAEYAKQAYELALLGLTDEEMAKVFGVDIAQFAKWAWEDKEFLAAITPTQEDIDVRVRQNNIRKSKRRSYKRERLRNSQHERIGNSMRARMHAALRGRTSGKCLSRLGYSLEELKIHLESRFSDGMSWGNYGKWHIDHIRPCASFDQTDDGQFGECWALSNLRPLWATDNLKKGAKHVSP